MKGVPERTFRFGEIYEEDPSVVPDVVGQDQVALEVDQQPVTKRRSSIASSTPSVDSTTEVQTDSQQPKKTVKEKANPTLGSELVSDDDFRITIYDQFKDKKLHELTSDTKLGELRSKPSNFDLGVIEVKVGDSMVAVGQIRTGALTQIPRGQNQTPIGQLDQEQIKTSVKSVAQDIVLSAYLFLNSGRNEGDKIDPSLMKQLLKETNKLSLENPALGFKDLIKNERIEAIINEKFPSDPEKCKQDLVKFSALIQQHSAGKFSTAPGRVYKDKDGKIIDDNSLGIRSHRLLKFLDANDLEQINFGQETKYPVSQEVTAALGETAINPENRDSLSLNLKQANAQPKMGSVMSNESETSMNSARFTISAISYRINSSISVDNLGVLSRSRSMQSLLSKASVLGSDRPLSPSQGLATPRSDSLGSLAAINADTLPQSPSFPRSPSILSSLSLESQITNPLPSARSTISEAGTNDITPSLLSTGQSPFVSFYSDNLGSSRSDFREEFRPSTAPSTASTVSLSRSKSMISLMDSALRRPISNRAGGLTIDTDGFTSEASSVVSSPRNPNLTGTFQDASLENNPSIRTITGPGAGLSDGSSQKSFQTPKSGRTTGPNLSVQSEVVSNSPQYINPNASSMPEGFFQDHKPVAPHFASSDLSSLNQNDELETAMPKLEVVQSHNSEVQDQSTFSKPITNSAKADMSELVKSTTVKRLHSGARQLTAPQVIDHDLESSFGQPTDSPPRAANIKPDVVDINEVKSKSSLQVPLQGLDSSKDQLSFPKTPLSPSPRPSPSPSPRSPSVNVVAQPLSAMTSSRDNNRG